MTENNSGRAIPPRRRVLVMAACAACVLVAVGAGLLGPRWWGPSGPPLELTDQEIADVTAAVRERSPERIRNIKVDRDRSVLVFVSDGRGRQEFRVKQVEGRWRVVGETLFFRVTAPA